MFANRGKAMLCLCILSSLLLLSHFLRPDSRESIHFESLRDFSAFAEDRKLHHYANSCNVFVADHPVDSRQLQGFRMSDLGTPPWRGIILVGPCALTDEAMVEMVPETFDRPYRIWGKLVATGDEELLNRIERLYGEK